MCKRFFLLLLLVLAISVSKAGAQFILKDFMGLHRMIGTWSTVVDDNETFETWKFAEKGKLTAESYQVNEEDTIYRESLSFELVGSNIYYVQKVGAVDSTINLSYVLSKIKRGSYHFINNDIEFPNKITYFPQNDSTLVVTVSGRLRGGEREISYTLKKMKE